MWMKAAAEWEVRKSEDRGPLKSLRLHYVPKYPVRISPWHMSSIEGNFHLRRLKWRDRRCRRYSTLQSK